MPSEFGLTNTIQKHQSLETLKETYKQRLDAILYKQLTVDNIESFANDALSSVVLLTEDILNESKKNPEFHFNPSSDKKTQEDEAYKILGLPDIEEILQSVVEMKEKINSLKTYIQENMENVDEVITPPTNTNVKIEEGENTFIKKRIFPRLLTLLYILEYDFGITSTPDNVPIKEGITTSNMMRKTPYVRIEIPDLDRVVYICDEEGNVSYIFDTQKLIEQKITLEKLDLDDKEEKNLIISSHPGIGIRLSQSKNWRDYVTDILGGSIPEKQKEEIREKQREKRSEFKKRERIEFLSFVDFQTEVKSLYTEQGDVSNWFREERKNHSNWPSHPDRAYKDKGWEGFPELVDRENFMKKPFLSFTDFKTEVNRLYSGKEYIQLWYRKERKNHPQWPSNPGDIYKDKGWEGWPELLGKENLFKKVFLPFEDFQTEVKNLYPGQGDIERWYLKEKKQHPNWSSQPHVIYKDKGWLGWPELVNKENFLKKTLLSFIDFQAEVKNLYPGQGNVNEWYKKERKNHSNWHSNPNIFYKDKGWNGWPKLLSK